MKQTFTLFALILLHCVASGQIVSPHAKSKPVRTRPNRISTNDTNRIYVVRHAPENMRIVQFGMELGTVFIADSAHRSYLPKKQVIHYGANLRIGDIYKNRVYGIMGVELYAQKSKPVTGSGISVGSTYKKNIFNLMGYMGCQVPFHLSELTSINLSSAFIYGFSSTPNPEDEVNYFGVRLGANIERRLGTLPIIGVFGINYDNNFIVRDDRSPATRNPNLLKMYFGIRI
ncbi:hypothetical protein D3C87_200910 [compost metagenome]